MSQLEDQVKELQKRLDLSRGFSLISEWLNNVLPGFKPINKLIGNESILYEIAIELSQFALNRSQEIETNKYFEDVKLTIDDVKILKEILTKFKAHSLSNKL